MVVLIAIAVLGAACTASSQVTESSSTTTVADSDTLPGETTTTLAADEEIVEGASNDIVAFVSDLAVLLKDSPYADALEEDPEVFVASAKLLCEMLATDAPPFEVLREYAALLGGGSTEGASDETLDLAGWLFGTAVGTFCPEYSDRLEGFES